MKRSVKKAIGHLELVPRLVQRPKISPKAFKAEASKELIFTGDLARAHRGR